MERAKRVEEKSEEKRNLDAKLNDWIPIISDVAPLNMTRTILSPK